MEKVIDTTNHFGLCCVGPYLQYVAPVRGVITKDQALTMAAWLITLSGANDEEFQQVLEAVQNA